MLNNHELKMHALLWLMLLASCSSLVNGEESEFCKNRYLTINTYGDLNAINVTCLGAGVFCSIFSSPPGNGCSQDSLTQIGKVYSRRTRVITSNLPYGTALCSNYQTSLQVGNDFTPIVQLPRATQAGKLFHTAFRYQQSDRSFKCGISALASPANVQYAVTSTATNTEMVVNKYQTEDITFDVTEDSPKVLKIISNAPVIVSCQETTNSESQLIVLEPISSQPLMIVSPPDGYFSFTIADCTTNDIISDSNRVSARSSVYSEDGKTSCDQSSVGDNFYLTDNLCATLIVPQDDNACVSALAYDSDFDLVAVGLSRRKLTKQLVRYPYKQVQYYFSFDENTCLFSYGDNVDRLGLVWLPGDQKNQAAGAYTESFINKYDLANCRTPAYILFKGDDYVSFRSGYQSEPLWQEYIESIECDNIPVSTPPPTPTPSETPTSPSKAIRLPLDMGLINIFLAYCGYLVFFEEA